MSLGGLPAELKSQIFRLLAFESIDSLQNELCALSMATCTRDWKACLASVLPMRVLTARRVPMLEPTGEWVRVRVNTRFFDLRPSSGPVWEPLNECYGFDVSAQADDDDDDDDVRIRVSGDAALAVRNLAMLLAAQMRYEYPALTFTTESGRESFSIALTAVACDEKMMPELDGNLWGRDEVD